MTARLCASPRCFRIHVCTTELLFRAPKHAALIRLKETSLLPLPRCLRFAALSQEAGCSLVTVHGRQRDRALHHAPANWQAKDLKTQ